jgi:hypothetical protein
MSAVLVILMTLATVSILSQILERKSSGLRNSSVAVLPQHVPVQPSFILLAKVNGDWHVHRRTKLFPGLFDTKYPHRLPTCYTSSPPCLPIEAEPGPASGPRRYFRVGFLVSLA